MSVTAVDMAYRAARRSILAELEAAAFSPLAPGTDGNAQPVEGYWVRRCRACGHDINHDTHLAGCWLEAFLATYQERRLRWCKRGYVCPFAEGRVHGSINPYDDHPEWGVAYDRATPWAIEP